MKRVLIGVVALPAREVVACGSAGLGLEEVVVGDMDADDSCRHQEQRGFSAESAGVPGESAFWHLESGGERAHDWLATAPVVAVRGLP